ncbi:AbrB/MazE/SpoVT family DNA-binding domain-containing protein [bacterium]|nr:AbrB/MazE/SpoVT family DNA-binding domain-containing protein [bacterium]
MRAKIVKIGNSRGIRIPKPLLEQSGLSGEVELTAAEGQITLTAVTSIRNGWGEAFRKMAAAGDDALLEPDSPMPATDWDDREWEWE